MVSFLQFYIAYNIRKTNTYSKLYRDNRAVLTVIIFRFVHGRRISNHYEAVIHASQTISETSENFIVKENLT